MGPGTVQGGSPRLMRVAQSKTRGVSEVNPPGAPRQMQRAMKILGSTNGFAENMDCWRPSQGEKRKCLP